MRRWQVFGLASAGAALLALGIVSGLVIRLNVLPSPSEEEAGGFRIKSGVTGTRLERYEAAEPDQLN